MREREDDGESVRLVGGCTRQERASDLVCNAETSKREKGESSDDIFALLGNDRRQGCCAPPLRRTSSGSQNNKWLSNIDISAYHKVSYPLYKLLLCPYVVDLSKENCFGTLAIPVSA